MGVGRRFGVGRCVLVLLAVLAAVLPLVPGGRSADAAVVSFSMTTVRAMAVDPVSGVVLVAGDDKVVVADAAGALLGEVTGLEGASGIAVVGGDAFVTERTTDTISRVDIASRMVTATWPAGGDVLDAAVAHDGALWFVVAGGALRRMDAATGATEARGAVAATSLTAVPGAAGRLIAWSNAAVVGSTATALVELDVSAPTATVAATSPLTDRFSDVAVAGDGSVVWAASQTQGLLELERPGLAQTFITYGGVALAKQPSLLADAVPSADNILGAYGSTVTQYQLGTVQSLSSARAASVRQLAVSADGVAMYAVIDGIGATTKGLDRFVWTLVPASATVWGDPVPVGVESFLWVDVDSAQMITAVTVDGAPVPWTNWGGSIRVSSPATSAVGDHDLVVERGIAAPAVGTITVEDAEAPRISGTVRGGRWTGPSSAGSVPVVGAEVTITGLELDAPVVVVTDALGQYTSPPMGFGREIAVSVRDPSGEFVGERRLAFEISGFGDILENFGLSEVEAHYDGDIPETWGHVDAVAVDDGVVLLHEDGLLQRYDEAALGVVVERAVPPGSRSVVAVGSDLWVNPPAGPGLLRLDAATLQIEASVPRGSFTNGALAVAGGRMWFPDRRWGLMGLRGIDPGGIGAPMSVPGAWSDPRLGSVADDPDLLIVWEPKVPRRMAVFDVGGPAPVLLADTTLATPPGERGVTASAALDRVWMFGAVLRLSDLAPVAGAEAPAQCSDYDPAHGGVLVQTDELWLSVLRPPDFDRLGVASLWQSECSEVLLAPDASRAVVDAGRLAGVDLRPFASVDQRYLRPEAPATAVLSAGLMTDMLAFVSEVRVDGTVVPYSVELSPLSYEVPMWRLHVSVPQELVGAVGDRHVVSLTSPFGTVERAGILWTGYAAPGAPRSASAALVGRDVRVTWLPPTSSGSMPVDSYVVSFAGEDHVVPADGLGDQELVIDRPAAGSWFATVAAVSEDGTGPTRSSGLLVVPAVLPGVPGGVNATPLAGGAVVSWSPPANAHDAALSGFEVRTVGSFEVTTLPADATSLLVPELPADVAVTFEVRSVGADGDSAWVQALPVTPTALVDLFSDVAVGHPFYWDVWWSVQRAVVGGYADGSFRPTASVSRQAAVAFLHRLAGEPAAVLAPGTFSDVSPSHPFAEAIAWAIDVGIVAGYPDGTFRPTALVSRQAAVAWLHRLAGEPAAVLAPGTFSDVSPSHPFAEAIAWAIDVGIVAGYPEGTFRPTTAVSRQAAVAFLHRYDTLG